VKASVGSRTGRATRSRSRVSGRSRHVSRGGRAPAQRFRESTGRHYAATVPRVQAFWFRAGRTGGRTRPWSPPTHRVAHAAVVHPPPRRTRPCGADGSLAVTDTRNPLPACR